MRRRSFLKKIPMLTGATMAMGGVPINLFAKKGPFMRLAEQSTNNRVLIILQLDGGNDGVNTLIPVEQYDLYYSRRANIAIPASNSVRKMIQMDATLPYADQVGLHPDMIGVKEMYDQGQVCMIQGVSYRNNNGSHFRGKDIWFMGGSFEDYFSSGWVGRYLQQNYAPQVYPDDFPNAEMEDPLAIELGSDVSLVFHQDGNIPSSISLGGNPDTFANLVAELEGFQDEGLDPRGKPPEILDNSPYGQELNWILGLEDKTEDYAERLQAVYNRAPQSKVTYPERYPFNAPTGSARNPLSGQLRLVARLLDGGGDGVKTKVFLVKIGGFDTHALQSENYDPTMGIHAALLYHISSAMKAFHQDLRERGIEDRVLTVTTSEFGRRVHSNGSFGTDHGTGGPIMVFGKYANPGIIGTNPDMSKNNVDQQYDYRQVYANILKDWLGVDKSVIDNDIFFGNFIDGVNELGGFYEPLPIIGSKVTSTEQFINKRYWMGKCYPNPAYNHTTIDFHINSETFVDMRIIDLQGRLVSKVVGENRIPGLYEETIQLGGLKPGVYLIQIRAGLLRETRQLVITR